MSTLLMAIAAGGFSSAHEVDEPDRPTLDALIHPWMRAEFRELEGKRLQTIAEDSFGRMWFGIESGVTRYDGRTWKEFHFDTPDPNLAARHLVCRRNGNVLVGNQAGIYELDSNGVWTQLFPRPGVRCDYPVTSLIESRDGVIWATSKLGLLRLDHERSLLLTSGALADRAQALLGCDSVAVIPEPFLPRIPWTRGTGMITVRRTVVALSPDSPARESGIRIGDQLLETNHGIRRTTAGVVVGLGSTVDLTISRAGASTPRTFSFLAREVQGQWPSPHMQSVMEADDGRIWLGAADGMVLRLNVSSDLNSLDHVENWEDMGEGRGLKMGRGPNLSQSNDGTIWLTNRNRLIGVQRFDGEAWHEEIPELQRSTSSHNSVTHTLDGTTWVSGNNVLHARQNGSWRSFATRGSNVPGDRPYLYASSDGALWVVGFEQYAVRVGLAPDEGRTLQHLRYQTTDHHGADWFLNMESGGVTCWHENMRRDFEVRDGLISHPIAVFAVEGHQIMAVGSDEEVPAVAIWRGKVWVKYPFPGLNAWNEPPAVFEHDDGSIWIAAAESRDRSSAFGFLISSGDDWRFAAVDELPAMPQFARKSQDGTVMVGTTAGAIILRDDQWQQPNNARIARASITCADSTDDGIVWLGTRADGVFCYEDGNWSQFTTDEGLLANDIVDLAVISSRDIWVNTAEGICRFDSRQFRTMNVFANQHFTHLSASSDGSIWLDGWVQYVPDSEPPETQIDAFNERLEAKSTALVRWSGSDAWNRTKADDLEFSWRLNDGKWSTFGPLADQQIANLAPGRHRIEVRSRDLDGNIDPTPAGVTIRVLPPIWQQPWVVALSAGLLILIGWQATRIVTRGRQLKRINVDLNLTRAQVVEAYTHKSAQFESICNHSPIGIFVCDHEGKLTYINHQLQALTGLSESQASGQGWLDAIHPDDRQRCSSLWRKTVETQQSAEWEARILRADGDVFEFIARADVIKDGDDHKGFVAIVENTTERRRLEHDREAQLGSLIDLGDRTRQLVGEISNQSEFFRTVAESVKSLMRSDVATVSIVNPDRSTFSYVAACGRCCESVQGMTFPLDKNGLCSSVINSGEPALASDLKNHPMASREFVELTSVNHALLVPLKVEGEVVGGLGAFREQNSFSEFEVRLLNLLSLTAAVAYRNLVLHRDLERRVEERTKELADANLDLESYAHSVAHDLRAPLRAMSGFSLALREDFGSVLDDEGREYIGFIESAAHQMDQLIQDLLDYSRVGRRDISIATVNLDRVVTRSLEQLEAEISERNAVVSTDTPLGDVVGHEATLVQVVSNLVSNGVKFVERGVQPQVRLSTVRNNGSLRLIVEDNGIGVESKYHERIFRVFERLHGMETYPGTGIGLAIVRRAMETLGGDFGVDSPSSTGSRFWIELDCQDSHESF